MILRDVCVHEKLSIGSLECGHPELMKILNSWAEVLGYDKLGELLGRDLQVYYVPSNDGVSPPPSILCANDGGCKFFNRLELDKSDIKDADY